MSGVLLVTGGSRGIGAAVSRLAAAAGYAVAINYRSGEDEAFRLAAELSAAGARAVAIQGDVGVDSDVVAMFDQAVNQLGPLTALVNSAGVSGHSRVVDFDAGSLETLMRVNVIGTMLCCREAGRRMSTARGGVGGAVVNISSMAATIGGRPGSAHYAASKGAVDVFTVGFAKEVATQGIRVNAVRPGVTLTDMTASLRDDADLAGKVAATIAMNRIAEADEVAAPVLWLLSPEASFVSGCRLDVSGGGFVIGASTERQ